MVGIPYHCSACGNGGKAAAKYAGRIVKCPTCQEPVMISAPTSPIVATDTPASSTRFLVVWATLVVLAVGFLGATFYAMNPPPAEVAEATSPAPPPLESQPTPFPTAKQPPDTIDALNREAPSRKPEAEPEIITLEADRASKQIAPQVSPVDDLEMRGLELIEKGTARDWQECNDAQRAKVAELLLIIIKAMDPAIDFNGAGSIEDYLDIFYSHDHNLNKPIGEAVEGFQQLARGFQLWEEGSQNSTTDSFYFSGDGTLVFAPIEANDFGVYSVSVHDHETTRSVKSNVLMDFNAPADSQVTRLRLPPGSYYLEVTSTLPQWRVMVVSERGLAYVNRKKALEEDQNAR